MVMAVSSWGKCPSNPERFNLSLPCVNEVTNEVLEAQSGGCELVRLGAGFASLVGFAFATTHAFAADEWAGSATVSSDYFVRGISRTSNHAALQLDLYYSNPNGFLAGVFASNTKIDPGEPADVELSAFLGYGWSLSDVWHARIIASHYAYPWNRAGSHYDYDELDLDVSYQGWLHFDVGYSPNSPRFVPQPCQRLLGVTEKSAEISAQRQIIGTFSLTAGVGYSFLNGPQSGGYAYWSGGAAYDFRAVTLAVSYINTSAEAKSLFYNTAASGQWTGSVIWRF
jgi:uncharacterized protein (TIGR02001 family)